MVYESDFYTTRRPYYSRPSPTITSYSVTYDAKLAPGLGKIVWCSPISGRLYYVGQTYHHNIPHVGHMRLTAIPYVPYSGRTRPSVLLAEIDRINAKVRPSFAYQPAEDFLNSRSIVNFDDEARSIRAHTAALLKRIHAPLPRAHSALPYIQPRYIETPIPERITSDAYIERMLSPMRNVQRDINSRSYYSDAAAKSNIGKGHLACVSYSGGKAYSRRKNLFYADIDQIKNEVKFLSHYEKTREAANVPQVDSEGEVYYAPLYTRPSRDPNKPFNSRFYKGAVTAPIEPAKRISARVVASVPAPPSSRSMSIPVVETPASVSQVERQTSLKEEPACEELDDMASRISRKKKKKQEERVAEELEQLEMAKKAEQIALEAANEEKKREEERRKAEEARKEAERLAEEERLEAERKAEEERLAEEARQEAERKAEEERKEAERKAEEARKEAERKAEEERKEAERIKAEEERLEAERKAEAERLEAERKAEEERLEREKIEAEEREAEAARLLEAEKQAEAERQAAAEQEAADQKLQEEEAELAQLEAEAQEVDTAEQIQVEQTEPESEPVPSEEPEPTVTSPQTEEPEPNVEEPASPGIAPASEVSGLAIEELQSEDE